MADRMVFTDLHPSYDGEYDFDGTSFTNRELNTIKRLSGCRLGELEDALNASDSDVIMALGIICLQRHNKPIDEDVFWNAKAGTIQVLGEEDETSPLAVTAGGSLSVSGSPKEPSGQSSNGSSENQANGQSLTGSPPSDTSATSESGMLATSPRSS